MATEEYFILTSASVDGPLHASSVAFSGDRRVSSTCGDGGRAVWGFRAMYRRSGVCQVSVTLISQILIQPKISGQRRSRNRGDTFLGFFSGSFTVAGSSRKKQPGEEGVVDWECR